MLSVPVSVQLSVRSLRFGPEGISDKHCLLAILFLFSFVVVVLLLLLLLMFFVVVVVVFFFSIFIFFFSLPHVN